MKKREGMYKYIARCEWSGRDKVIWRVCSVSWRSKPRTGSFAQLLRFSLLPLYWTGDVSARQTDPPSWSLSLVASSVNPIDFLFMSPEEKLQSKAREKKKKKKGLCIVKWLVHVSDSAFTISTGFFFSFLELLFEALCWWGFLFVWLVFLLPENVNSC